MGFKLRHTSAVRMLADSALHMSPLKVDPPSSAPKNPYADHYYSVKGESQADAINAKNYQNKLRKNMGTNPEGYFEIYSPYHGKTQIYDKALYGQDEKGNLKFHEKTHTRDKSGNIVSKQLNVPKPKTTDKKEKPKGKIDLKKYKGGGLQTQEGWGDMKHITLGHGEKSNANKVSDIIGVPSSLSGGYTDVETKNTSLITPDMKKTFDDTNKMLKKELSKDKKKDTPPPSSSDKSNSYSQAKAKDSNLDQYIKDRDAAEKGSADYAFAQNQINKAYGVEKRHKADMVKMETKGPQQIENKMQRTITTAMDPSFDNISSRTGKGGDDRYTRMSKRQEKRTQKALGTWEKPESARQERKNLLTDNPVDKDATGGRYKNDKATKKLVKETSKQAKKDNAMKDAKAAVEAGDKKALRKSGVAGKYKRAGREDIAGAKEAGAMDAAKAAVESGDKKALRKSGVEGKYKRAGRQDIAATEKQKKKTAKKIEKSKLPRQESAKQEASDLLSYSPVADREASTFDYSQSKRENKKRYK